MPFLEYKEHRVYYHQYGTGKKLLIAFHGFADNGDLFEDVATNVFAQEYTTIAIDLPFHGQETVWQGDIYMPEDIVAIIGLLIEGLEIQCYALACHSMGGRVVWGILPLVVDQIEQIYFFAPAGFGYTFTASRFWCPLWIRKRARNRFEESEGILHFFEVTHRLKLMNRATYLVFKQQLDLPRRRARLLQTWVSMYYFPMGPDKKHLQLLNEKEIPTYFFFGKKDRVTPAKKARKFIQKLKHSELKMFKGNHFFVRDKLAKPLKVWYEGLEKNQMSFETKIPKNKH